MSFSERHTDTHRQRDSNTSIDSHPGNYELVRARDGNWPRHRHVISGRPSSPYSTVQLLSGRLARHRVDCIAHDYLLWVAEPRSIRRNHEAIF